MAELFATIDERAAAAQAAHQYAWRRQRQADLANDPITAAFFADTCAACLAELEDCAQALRAGVDADLAAFGAPAANDGIQRGNTDLPALSGHASLR